MTVPPSGSGRTVCPICPLLTPRTTRRGLDTSREKFLSGRQRSISEEACVSLDVAGVKSTGIAFGGGMNTGIATGMTIAIRLEKIPPSRPG